MARRFNQKGRVGGAFGSTQPKGKPEIARMEQVPGGSVVLSAAEKKAIGKVVYKGDYPYMKGLKLDEHFLHGDQEIIKSFFGIIGHALRYYNLSNETRIAFQGLMKKLNSALKSK